MTLTWIVLATLAGGVVPVAIAASLGVSQLSRIVQTAAQLFRLAAGLAMVLLAMSQLREH